MANLTSPVSVPHCFLPNSLIQTFEPETCKRTAFQVNYLAEVAKREDFAYFITGFFSCTVIVDHRNSGKFIVTWISKDGAYHNVLLGKVRVLFEATHPGAPAALDSAVYQVRCRVPTPEEAFEIAKLASPKVTILEEC